MTASVEDNYSDLCIAALQSIEGFHKKTGKTFDEMFPLKLFDQYTKTCLWTMKAKKGIGLTARMPFRNKHVDCSLEDLENLISDKRYTHLIARDIYDSLDSQCKKAIKLLEQNPEFMTKEGDIKENRLAGEMGISVHSVNKIIKRIKVKNGYNN